MFLEAQDMELTHFHDWTPDQAAERREGREKL